ncbi:MAG TPA: S-adenosylmethionine decarboxylase [Candidatus Babeliales bacterium]|nr:S-adenosylmethionine decarboxylase [Candidatus Babeliales bacterium]
MKKLVLMLLSIATCAQLQASDSYVGKSYAAIQRAFDSKKAWALTTNIDVCSCDMDKIRSAGQLQDFCIQLCSLLNIQRYGEAEISHPGDTQRTTGYLVMQPIERGYLAIQCANATNNVYIDLVSCKVYNPYAVVEAAKKFFGAQDTAMSISLRV